MVALLLRREIAAEPAKEGPSKMSRREREVLSESIPDLCMGEKLP